MSRRNVWVAGWLVVAGCSGSTKFQSTTPDAAPDSATADEPDLGQTADRLEAGSGGASGTGAGDGAGGSLDGGADGTGSGAGGNAGSDGTSGVGGDAPGGAGTSGGSGGSAGAAGAGGSGVGGDAGDSGAGGIEATGGSAGAAGAGTGGSGSGGQAGSAAGEGGVPGGGTGGTAGQDGGVGGMGGGSMPSPWFPAQSTNNSVELRGAPFGTDCAKTNPTLRRKTVPVTGLSASFQLGDAYVLTQNGGLVASIGIPVSNLSDQLLCFGMGALDLKTQTGDSIVVPHPGLQLIGSVATTGAPQYSTSCLGRGETGVLTASAATEEGDDVYTPTRSLVVTLDAGTPATRPPASVVPLLYAADGDGLHVTIENQGTAAASILSGRKSFYLHLDDQGLPVKFGTLADNPVPNGNLTPNQDGSINDASATGLVGCGDRVRPFINFGVPSN